MNKKLLIFIYLTVSIYLYSQVDNGFIDLTHYDFFTKPPVELVGEWKFIDVNGVDRFLSVPGSWGSELGKAVYSLTIESSGADNLILETTQINSFYEVVLNGKALTSSSEIRPLHIPLSLDKGSNILTVTVENYSNINGGIRNRVRIGDFNKMLKHYDLRVLHDSAFTGAALIMSLFFLILFFNNKKDDYSMLFAAICFFLAIRTFVTNDKVLYDYILNIPYSVITRLEYLSIYILPSLLLLFIKRYFKTIKYKTIFNIVFYPGLIFTFTSLFLPSKIYISILYWFFVYILISSSYALILLITFYIRKITDSGKILLSMFVLIFSGVYDIFIILYQISNKLIATNGIIIFIMMMSIIISQKEIRNQKRVKSLTLENKRVNKYLSRFVPNSFIQTVGLGDHKTIKRGDGVEKDMTILFSTIANFNRDVVLLKGSETIDLLNNCYSIISPIITRYGGFIDKFIDETVMALFPGSPDNAIKAAIEINRYTKGMHVNFQTGIHSGKQFIGIVGDHKRVDATVISDVVNTASRINRFAAKIDRDILISEETLAMIDQSQFKHTFMGRVKLKGKTNFIGIHAIYVDTVNSGDKIFSHSMKELELSSLENIESVIKKISLTHPDHKPAQYYLELIRKNRRLEDAEK